MSALAANVQEWIKEIPDHLRTPEVLNETVSNNPFGLNHVPDCLKTQTMCDYAIEKCLWVLKDVPDHLKTEKMCDKVVWGDPFSLQFVPDWFVTQQQLKLWHYYDDYCNDDDDDDDDDDDVLIKWYHDYQKHKAQKAKIKDELMPIAWHPPWWWNWCVPKDEKKETENFFI